VPGTGLTVESDTRLTVTSPAAPAFGPVQVHVVTPIGTNKATPAAAFGYVAAGAGSGPDSSAGSPAAGGAAAGAERPQTGQPDGASAPARDSDVPMPPTVLAGSGDGGAAVSPALADTGPNIAAPLTWVLLLVLVGCGLLAAAPPRRGDRRGEQR
jgi:hypothetical protein